MDGATPGAAVIQVNLDMVILKVWRSQHELQPWAICQYVV